MLAALGIGLLVAPEDARSLWPWPLSPLTGRAVGAWLIGMALLAMQVVLEDACERAEIAMFSYATFGVLQLVALARYPRTPDWRPAGAAGYIGFLVVIVAVGLDGWLRGRRASVGRTPERLAQTHAWND